MCIHSVSVMVVRKYIVVQLLYIIMKSYFLSSGLTVNLKRKSKYYGIAMADNNNIRGMNVSEKIYSLSAFIEDVFKAHIDLVH